MSFYEKLNQSASEINSIIRSRNVAGFKIGRSIDVPKRGCSHGCDAIFTVFNTSSTNFALQAEHTLINHFYNHPKCWNQAAHSGGNLSRDYYQNVYVAVWYK